MTPLLGRANGQDLTGLVGWVVDVVATLGPVGVGLLLALDNVLPVIPSEVVLPFAGYLSAQGRMPFVLAVLGATVGATASAYVYYELGRRLGEQRARAAMLRIPLMDDEDLERATRWFDRHGTLAVFTGRFVPFVRSVISFPAGTQGMGRIRFGLLTALGSGLWNLIWLWVGRVVGQRWQRASAYSDMLNAVLVAVLVAVVANYVWQRRDRIGSGRT